LPCCVRLYSRHGSLDASLNPSQIHILFTLKSTSNPVFLNPGCIHFHQAYSLTPSNSSLLHPNLPQNPTLHRGRVFSHSGQREPTKLLFLPTPTYLFRVCNLPAPRCALALKKIQSDRPTLPLDLFTHHSVTATMAVRTGMAHFRQHPIIPTLLPFFLRTTPWPFSHSVFLF
jgi:hypothetical protein